MRKLMFRTGTVLTALATALALQATIAPGAEAAIEKCTDPAAVFGSFALRACVTYDGDGGVLGFAYVSLAQGHSDCIIRGRIYRTSGDQQGPWDYACPNSNGDAYAHYRTPYLPITGASGIYYSAYSMRRVGETENVVQAVSPTLKTLP